MKFMVFFVAIIGVMLIFSVMPYLLVTIYDWFFPLHTFHFSWWQYVVMGLALFLMFGKLGKFKKV